MKHNTAIASDTEKGNLAGSCLILNLGVKNMVELVGATLPEAIKMATVNPAKRLGLANKGSLLPSKDADVVVFSPNLDAEHVFVLGREIPIA